MLYFQMTMLPYVCIVVCTFKMEQIRNGSALTNTQIRQKQVTMNDLSVLPFRLRKYHILRILFA